MQIEAIAKVDGIDVLFIGPYDLGNNIGHPVTGEFAEELKTAIEKIRKAAAAAGKSSGIYATSGDQARTYADQGFNMVCLAFHLRFSLLLTVACADLSGCRHGCSTNLHVGVFKESERRLWTCGAPSWEGCGFGDSKYGLRTAPGQAIVLSGNLLFRLVNQIFNVFDRKPVPQLLCIRHNVWL